MAKRYIVTGGAGFLGTNLVMELLKHDEYSEIFVLDNFSRGNNIVEDDRVSYIDIDLADAKRFNEASLYFGKGVDVVFNLAASVGGIYHNIDNNYLMYKQNIPLLTNPVMLAMKGNVKTFVQLSSVCVYPDGQTSPCDDIVEFFSMPNNANLGYALAKQAGETIALSSNMARVIIARPSNLYGEYDYFDKKAHVIPALIKKTINDLFVEVKGDGSAIREFLYVKDAAKALIHLSEHGADRTVYNIGTNHKTAISIGDLTRKIVKLANVENKTILFDRSAETGDDERWTLAEKLEWTGFKAETSLDEGLRKTIEWYKENMPE